MPVRTNLNASDQTATRQKQTVSQYQILKTRLIETPCAELRGMLQQAVEENPLLEIDETHEFFTVGAQTAGVIEDTGNFFEKNIDTVGRLPSQPPSRSLKSIADFAATRETNVDYRIELRLLVHNSLHRKKERDCADDILNALDEHGFFCGNLSIIAVKNRCTEEEVASVLSRIQSMFHNGIGARDEVEALCLCLEDPQDRQLARGLLTDYLRDVLAGRFSKVAKVLGITESRITELMGRLVRCRESLDMSETSEVIQYLYPDIIARNVDGIITVEIAGGSRSPLRLNSYSRLLENEGLSKVDRAYIEEKSQDAARFISSLEGRNKLLASFAKLLVHEEHDFFVKPSAPIVPLSMEGVAEQLSVSLSTISRMCKDKYILTDRGSFPLGFFFMKSFSTIDTAFGQQKMRGDEISHMIIQVIDDEDPTEPLSDQQIAEILAASTGMQLARRTVAKYRAAANIPNSVVRRKTPCERS